MNYPELKDVNLLELFHKKHMIEDQINYLLRNSPFLEKLKKHLASSNCIFFEKIYPISSYRGEGLAIHISKHRLINNHLNIELQIEFTKEYHDGKDATYIYLDGPISDYLCKTYNFIYPIQYEIEWKDEYFDEWLEAKRKEIKEKKNKWVLINKINKNKRIVSGCETLEQLMEMVPNLQDYSVTPIWNNDDGN